jgi:hypothetical protein
MGFPLKRLRVIPPDRFPRRIHKARVVPEEDGSQFREQLPVSIHMSQSDGQIHCLSPAALHNWAPQKAIDLILIQFAAR